MAAPGNRDVTVLILLKASGGAIWGASDIVMARYALIRIVPTHVVDVDCNIQD
jgi:hypothetical protein